MLKNLKKLRAEHKVSQKQLAEAISTSQQSINKYENHNIEPDIATLIDIADYFHTSVDYLIGHTDICRKIEPISEYALNREEELFITNFRHLSASEKKSILLVIENYLQKKQ